MSDDGGGDIDWVFYSDRLEWKDVEPMPQNDSPYPVVQIAYSEKFKDIFNYFRSVLDRKEISERALKLSEDAATVNPGNYTVWRYRRILLKELNKDLSAELKYCQQVIEDSPKSYQTWYHRQVLVEWMNDPGKEKQFTERILMNDAKNYHAWQHRQWVIKKFDLWHGELEFVNTLIEDDVRNNSAWNQRYFVVTHEEEGLTPEVLKGEIKYTLEKIKMAPNNESPWNYLRGILQNEGLSRVPEVVEFTEGLYSCGCRSPHLLGFLIDIFEEHLLLHVDEGLLNRATEICESLSTKHDTIRTKYWQYVARNLKNLYGSGNVSKVADGETDSD